MVTGISLSLPRLATVAQATENPVAIFDNLYTAFVILGSLVGIVVISYLLYNAYKYRADESTPEGQYDIEETDEEESVARPQLGEVPTGVGKAGGKKLFMSFAISAVIVLSLITFAYWNLLLVEGTPDDADSLDIGVEANQYAYTYEYPGGEAGDGTLYVPTDRVISLNITSCDPGECGEAGSGNVWHTWSSPDLRASGDAMPAQYTTTWFVAEETGTYRVECRELCGAGHSGMNFDEGVVALEDEEFKDWCLENGCMAEGELNDWLNRTKGEN
jgi:cytochrome c oxidase subunit 2